MARKSLIAYVSRTGNTEKVALRFKKVFEEHSWECDCIKITKNMKPVNLDGYALICVGSLIIGGAPARELDSLWMGGNAFPDIEPDRIPGGGPPPGDLNLGILNRRRDPTKYKKGIAFVTYGGAPSGGRQRLCQLSP